MKCRCKCFHWISVNSKSAIRLKGFRCRHRFRFWCLILYTNTYSIYMDPQIFLQCNSLDVRVLFMPCSQAESILAAGQNKPATESTEPLDVSKEDNETDHRVLVLICTPSFCCLSNINATNLIILLLSLMYFFCCWHIWKPFLLCAGVYVCARSGWMDVWGHCWEVLVWPDMGYRNMQQVGSSRKDICLFGYPNSCI